MTVYRRQELSSLVSGGGVGDGGPPREFENSSNPQLQLQQLYNLETLNQVAIQLQRNDSASSGGQGAGKTRFWASGFGFQVWGFRFRASGLGLQASGLGL